MELNNKTMPKITAIIPIYNVELYIERCLNSVMSQSYNDFECLCIDDCGTDDSIAIVQKIIEKDSRFRIISHEKNRGLSAARNTGIDNAKGEYIVCIDSDDWVDNTLFEFIVNAFEKATNKKIDYKIVERRSGDIGTCYADCNKALVELGFKTKKTIDYD